MGQKMGEFKISDHTADVRLSAFGESLEELFQQALRGMVSVMEPSPDVASQLSVGGWFKVEVSVKSSAVDLLLVDFLSEILCLSEINNKIYPVIEIISLDEESLVGFARGYKVDGFGTHIKAVTYHELKVTFSNGFWLAKILFDV